MSMTEKDSGGRGKPAAKRGVFAWWRRRKAPIVPVIRLSGVIGGVGGLRPSGLTASSLETAIARAFAVRRAPAVALAVNSPGGSPVQSALIAERVREAAVSEHKEVIAFIEDVGASGGYWLACAGDTIYADASSIVGSIGVISAGFGLHDAIARLGVERRVYTAGESKSLLDPFKPENPDDVAHLQNMLGDIHEVFKDLVRSRRGARLGDNPDGLFDGRIYTGRQALELGLIDGLGSLRGILRERFGDDVRLPVVNSGGGWLRRRMRAGLSIDDVALRLLESVEARLFWARYGL